MPTVEKAVKRYADQAQIKKILNRLARIVKARRKDEKRQRKEVMEELFTQVEEEIAKASEKVQRFVDSGYTTTKI
jgi:phosphoglycerate-specific signal transduction histidine kinase